MVVATIRAYVPSTHVHPLMTEIIKPFIEVDPDGSW